MGFNPTSWSSKGFYGVHHGPGWGNRIQNGGWTRDAGLWISLWSSQGRSREIVGKSPDSGRAFAAPALGAATHVVTSADRVGGLTVKA
jgi:hypothetical protein